MKRLPSIGGAKTRPMRGGKLGCGGGRVWNGMELIGVGTEAKLDVAVHQVVIEYAKTIRKL